ncbi:MAG: hypothetical protein ACOCPN_04210 [Desulfonatronovibrionaceae bacterium]
MRMDILPMGRRIPCAGTLLVYLLLFFIRNRICLEQGLDCAYGLLF